MKIKIILLVSFCNAKKIKGDVVCHNFFVTLHHNKDVSTYTKNNSMSEYIVSARKYRPMTFDSVVGQAALTTTLKNAVRTGKLAHAYLFCGPRGVGKTTCARIFARAINCSNPTAEGEACGECESCKAFQEQRSYNILELDAASNNGVNEIKDLMDQTRIPPQVGKYKVFIIDEVHMLTTSAFNAFLKTLEEPPQHVIFILATTEKHKILPTIISRCQIYDFDRMTIQNTVAHLKSVAEKEGIQYEERALALIAEKADGGMRDALSIFDQAASFCQNNITYDKVLEDLNVLDAENYFRIIDLSLENKVADVMVLLNTIIAKGFDPGHAVNGLAAHLRNVMMAKDQVTLPLLECSDEMRQRYYEQSQKCPANFIYRALQIMNQCDLGYRQSTNKRLLVEITLIQVAQLTQEDDAASSGRSPKRLKPLFKLLFGSNESRQQQVAPRVAAPASAVNTQEVANPQTAKPLQTTQTTPVVLATQVSPTTQVATSAAQTNNRPTGKIRFKTSLTALRSQMNNSQQTVRADEEVRADISNQTPFSQEDLDRVWLAMCLRMPKEMNAISARMKNLVPCITEFPAVEVVVESNDMMERLSSLSKRIQRTLQIDLNNSMLMLNIRQALPDEVKKVLTRQERLEVMQKENACIGKLCRELDLEVI